MENIDSYLSEIQKAYSHGNATEHTYRPFLQTLIESFDKEITAINEPKRRTFGATDFVIRKRDIPLGYIEAKDVDRSLDKLNKTEKDQMKRYLEALSNIIYTDHLEFRWFVRGELVQTVKIAEIENGKIKPLADNYEKLSNLFKEFLTKELDTVGSAKELAKRMASTTRLIRQTIETALEDDSDRSEDSLFGQYKSFQKTLLPNLEQGEFADLYSQTIAYGLFTARCYDNNKPFTRKKASYAIPKTNPFLRQIFDRIGGINLDERIVWAVDDLAELLNRTDISAILNDFGKRTRQEDPVVHFYETFLAEYDQKLRETRGVYYTPEPVVSYIVRSVDKVLQTHFDLPKGLADSSKIQNPKSKTQNHKVLILDPATGTGTFLYSVIKQIYKRYENNKGMWDSYVSEHLLPRIFGFELLVAPYAVAHLKLGLLLEGTGYDLDKDERLQIYLNNTLDFASLREESDAFSAFINEEASKGREIQQDKPVMAILGNPPYSGHSSNTGDWINNLLRGSDSFNEQPTENYFEVDGKPLGERNPKMLNDDYVKFIRFSQWRIDQTGYGVLGFVTNHGYLDNPTFRGMRQSLMNSFDEIYLLDLHGNAKKKEKSPDGSKDENVFDIQQGVSIGIFIKKKSEVQTGVQASLLAMSAKHEKPVADEKVEDETDTPSADGVASRMLALPTAKVFHKHLYGVRETHTKNVNDEKELTGGKYKYLNENDISTTDWTEIKPQKPFYLFVPQDNTFRKEYENYLLLKDIFPISTNGFVTSQDKFAIDFEKETIISRIESLRNLQIPDADILRNFR
ncbi:MAG: N-6 DNA methylase [Aridibacter sp.]